MSSPISSNCILEGGGTFTLRNFYNNKDYRLFLVLTSLNEEEAQTISRKLDPKIDFDYSYLEPPVRDEDSLSTL